MIDFVTLYAAISTQLFAVLILTAVDFVLGVTLALVSKSFKWDKLTSYISSDLVPILAWLALEVVSAIPAEAMPSGILNGLSVAVYGTVSLRILASILGSIASTGILTNQLNRLGVDNKYAPTNSKDVPIAEVKRTYG
jgi:hypothetical protein